MYRASPSTLMSKTSGFLFWVGLMTSSSSSTAIVSTISLLSRLRMSLKAIVYLHHTERSQQIALVREVLLVCGFNGIDKGIPW